jgi:hypothetical protein
MPGELIDLGAQRKVVGGSVLHEMSPAAVVVGWRPGRQMTVGAELVGLG